MVKRMYSPLEICRVEILNNLKLKSGTLFDRLNMCEFCSNEHKDNCDFVFKAENYKAIQSQINTVIRSSFVLVAVTQ